MPALPHAKRHFTGTLVVRDLVIGMSDGLTVPFALAAGLSGAALASSIVVMAGLAEIAAGVIAMGLGGFLAARSDADHYASEEAREHLEVDKTPGAEQQEIVDVLAAYGLTDDEVAPLVAGLKRRPGAWVDFMMRFEPPAGAAERRHHRRGVRRGGADPPGFTGAPPLRSGAQTVVVGALRRRGVRAGEGVCLTRRFRIGKSRSSGPPETSEHERA